MMKEAALPDYTEMSQALNQTTLKPHPSQAHGLICGLLCGNPKTPTAAWHEWILGQPSEIIPPLLQALHDITEKQLRELMFELALLLPDDDVPLTERAEALTLWAQGFLTGLKLTQVQIVEREPSEMTEAINDVIEIAKMNYEEVVASEEDEEAYVELVEYVRMAVIFIYQELRQGDARKASASAHAH